QNDRPDERPLRDGEREMGHPECGPRENDVAGGDEPTIVAFACENPDGGHHSDRAETARTDGDSRSAGGVAEHGLVEERKNRDEAVDDGAKQADEDAAHREISILEDFETH